MTKYLRWCNRSPTKKTTSETLIRKRRHRKVWCISSTPKREITSTCGRLFKPGRSTLATAKCASEGSTTSLINGTVRSSTSCSRACAKWPTCCSRKSWTKPKIRCVLKRKASSWFSGRPKWTILCCTWLIWRTRSSWSRKPGKSLLKHMIRVLTAASTYWLLRRKLYRLIRWSMKSYLPNSTRIAELAY